MILLPPRRRVINNNIVLHSTVRSPGVAVNSRIIVTKRLIITLSNYTAERNIVSGPSNFSVWPNTECFKAGRRGEARRGAGAGPWRTTRHPSLSDGSSKGRKGIALLFYPLIFHHLLQENYQSSYLFDSPLMPSRYLDK